MTTEDKAFKNITENKVEKSVRNNKLFKKAIKRAQEGDFDENVICVKGKNLLKVCEKWSIRKAFDIAQGKHYYKLFKEVFYINDPQKHYYDTVEGKVYRRIAAQKENGDLEWAKAVAEELGAEIVE